ncbi:hypothetical protein [Yersinia phage MHG19]|nr:hypothetical protein [Yersinia phage MHG19]
MQTQTLGSQYRKMLEEQNKSAIESIIDQIKRGLQNAIDMGSNTTYVSESLTADQKRAMEQWAEAQELTFSYSYTQRDGATITVSF